MAKALVKKEFTSFDVAAVVRELTGTVQGSRINNIYQLDDKTLLLKLHKTDMPPLNLILGAGRRLHLTSYAAQKPTTPPAFCMALRKYLRDGWLEGIEQYEFERVIVFRFKIKTGELRLVLELFGDGNIILVSEDGKILQALDYKRMRDRNILRGEPFAFAPSAGKNPLRISKEEMNAGLKDFGEVEIVRAMARLLSVGGFYAEEILLKAGIEKTRQCRTLEDSEISVIFDTIMGLLGQVRSGMLEPFIVLDEAGAFIDVVPFRLKRYDTSGFRFQSCGSFNEALDEFYSRTIATERAVESAKIDGLKREAERLKRIIADQERTLREAEAKTDQEKQAGDAIYAHSVELQALLETFSSGKQDGKEWKTIVSGAMAGKQSGLKHCLFFESFDAKYLIVHVQINDLTFGLDLRKTVFENAAEFYERGKRLKQKMQGNKAALGDSQRKLAEVEARIVEAETFKRAASSETAKELVRLKVKRKEWYEKFRWFTSSDGFLVVAGKDAVSNEVLIKKYTEEADVVFHADIVGAPFVVVKAEKKKPGEQCLGEAAEFAAAFSRGWREGFGSVDVYWVKPEQLSKAGPSGESVAHGAFVVHGERNWMRGVTLKLAIGVVADENGVARFVGGPVEAVKARTSVYAIIVPGDVAVKEMFKRIIWVLGKRFSKELQEKMLKGSIEEVREFIPYGVGRVMDS